MNLLCLIGLHKWVNYDFDKEPHSWITATYQKCIRCGKRRKLKHLRKEDGKWTAEILKFY